MKILVTGSHGYIGSHLIPRLEKEGHKIVRFQGDLFDPSSFQIPNDIEIAYYLVHSMKGRASHFLEHEKKCAENFVTALAKTNVRQVIYLSGICHDQMKSEHMSSRHLVEEVLKKGKFAITTFRAAVVIGKGSASFQILHDLVTKLPIMVAPRWIQSKSQPISIDDVLFYLTGAIDNPGCLDETFEIGGPDVLTYEGLMRLYAKILGKKRWILTVPVLTPYLSGLWLVFVTKAPFSLARALIDSLTHDATVKDTRINSVLPHACRSLEESLRAASLDMQSAPRDL